jgi:hypothetical protein
MNIRKNIAISDTGFIFDPSTGNSYSVNPQGLTIMNLLKDGKSPDEIIAFITGEYDADRNTVERDVQDFITILQRFRLNDTGQP